MPVTTKEALVISVKEQFALWRNSNTPYAYNTGAMGKQANPKSYDWSGDANIVPATDFREAYNELKSFVKEYSLAISYAKSGSLGDFNVWDLIIGQYDNSLPSKMNYHIKVSGNP